MSNMGHGRPPDHTISLTPEQYGEAIFDYLTKHKLLPKGRYYQSVAATQESAGRASLVVMAWRTGDVIDVEPEQGCVVGLLRTHTVTEANRHQVRVGQQWDQIVLTCQVTEDELDILRTRLSPGGKLLFSYPISPPGHACTSAQKE